VLDDTQLPVQQHYEGNAFKNIGYAMLTLFVALTGESFPDVMLPAYTKEPLTVREGAP